MGSGERARRQAKGAHIAQLEAYITRLDIEEEKEGDIAALLQTQQETITELSAEAKEAYRQAPIWVNPIKEIIQGPDIVLWLIIGVLILWLIR